MKKIVLFICILFTLSMVACSQGSASEKLGVRGIITKLLTDDKGNINGILVEGKLEDDTQYDKVTVYINEKSSILESKTNTRVDVSSLKTGIKVEVTLEGPVRESYPVQADAKVIKIIE